MVTIFTEGEWDTPFIRQVIERTLGVDVLNNVRIIDTKGYTSLHLSQPIFQETTDAGGTNLIIFDADEDANGGGYQVRSDYILAKKQELNIEFELFLFPNNNDDGMFETLLENIANDAHAPLLLCFDGYINCVNQTGEVNNINYTTPAQKAKIFAYVESILTPKEFREERNNKTWSYSKNDLWNFDSPNLASLKAFLSDNIQV